MNPKTCNCQNPPILYSNFTKNFIGTDTTNGRFGEVSIESCKQCNAKWLHYFVEYESFSQSARWYRGLISEEAVPNIIPTNAIDYLKSLEWHLFGGSYFNSTGERGSGNISVDLNRQYIFGSLNENEILISEFENIQKIGILNVDTLNIDWQPTQILNNNDYSGFSQKIGEQRFTFFKHKNKLNILAETQLIEIDAETESHLKRVGTELVFSISKNGAILFTQSHKQIESIVPIKDDPTPFIEAEDFDLRILIHNVLTENGRRDRMFNTD